MLAAEVVAASSLLVLEGSSSTVTWPSITSSAAATVLVAVVKGRAVDSTRGARVGRVGGGGTEYIFIFNDLL